MEVYSTAPLLGPAYVAAGLVALFAYAYYLDAGKQRQMKPVTSSVALARGTAPVSSR